MDQSARGFFGDRFTKSFARELETFGNRIALIAEDGAGISYADLAKRADAFADRLGESPRLLLIEASNDVEAIIAYLGGLRGGHPVMMAAEGTRARDPRLVDTYRPDAVFAREAGRWQLDLDRAGGHALHPDLAVLLSTSGSTGATKLVRLSARAIDANADAIGRYLEITPADRAATTLPIHYSYGLSVLNAHLARGASIVLTSRSVTDPAFWALVETLGVTALAGVPYTFELFDRIGFTDKALPALRTLTQAGGRLAPEAVERYGAWAEQRGVAFFVMYGATEATARMAYLPPSALAAHSDCIGVAIPGGGFTLVDEDGAPVTAADTPGELVYSGPNVMMGYATGPEDLARGSELDRLATGDIAMRNAHGLYRIVGRKSRFCKPFGLRISLDEVEEALRRHGWRGVVAGDDALIAVSLLGPAAPASVAATLAADFNLPLNLFHVAAVADQPRLPSGKIDYRRILADAYAAAAPVDTHGDAILAAFEHAFGRRPFAPTDSFAALGGDSLTYVTFAMEIEDRLGRLPDGWETLALVELQALAAAPQAPVVRAGWKMVDSDVALRALAIAAVVVNHASSLIVGGGAMVLLVLVGFNLARFQRARLAVGDVGPVVSGFFVRIVLPYYAMLVAYLLVKGELDVASLLLVSNFTGRFGSFVEPYWFIEALLQCMLIVAALFAVPRIRAAATADPWRFGLLLLGAALLVKMVAFGLFHHSRLADRTPDAIFFYVAIGWCLCFARTPGRRLAMVAVAASVALLTAGAPAVSGIWDPLPYPTNLAHAVWLTGATATILWLPRFALPEPVWRAVTAVSAASFYIYLVHGIPVYLALRVWQVDLVGVTLLVAILLGLLVARVAGRFRGNGGGADLAGTAERVPRISTSRSRGPVTPG